MKNTFGNYIVTVKGSVEIPHCGSGQEAIDKLFSDKSLLDLLTTMAVCPRPGPHPKAKK